MFSCWHSSNRVCQRGEWNSSLLLVFIPLSYYYYLFIYYYYFLWWGGRVGGSETWLLNLIDNPPLESVPNIIMCCLRNLHHLSTPPIPHPPRVSHFTTLTIFLHTEYMTAKGDKIIFYFFICIFNLFVLTYPFIFERPPSILETSYQHLLAVWPL